MKITYKHLFTVSALLTCVFLSTSCKDDDVDSEKDFKKEMAKVEEAYAKTFESIFGKIDPNQSWDFSNMGTRATRTVDASSIYDPTSKDSYNPNVWYKVDQTFKETMDSYLPETQNNHTKGKDFVLLVPDDGIEINLFPAYQGTANSYWEMHMVVVSPSGEILHDIPFWEKNKGIEINKPKVYWDGNSKIIRNKYQIANNKPSNLQAIDLINPAIIVKAHEKTAETWDNQFIIKAKKILEPGCYNLAFWYKASIVNGENSSESSEAKVTLDLMNETGKYITGASNFLINHWGDNEFTFTENWTHANLYFWVSQDNNIIINNEVKGKNLKHFNFNLNVEDRAIDYYFGDIVLNKVIPQTDSQNNTSYTFVENLLDQGKSWIEGNIENNFETYIRPKNGVRQKVNTEIHGKFSLASDPYGMTHNHKTNPNPYISSKEVGLRYAVVTVGSPYNAKYLFAFTDKPENGKFVSVNSSNELCFIDIDKLEDAKPLNCYGGPTGVVGDPDHPENLGFYDDQFMIGEYILSVDKNTGKIVAESLYDLGADRNISINDLRPWSITDKATRDKIREQEYQWDFETYNRYTYEAYTVGCSFNPNTNSFDNFKDANFVSKNISNLYNHSGDSEYMNVRLDYSEQTMGNGNSGTRCNRFKFNFPAELKGSLVYFYWDTQAPCYRRYSNVYNGQRIEKQMLVVQGDNLKDVLKTYDGNQSLESTLTFRAAVGCEAGVVGHEPDEDYNDMIFILAANKEPTFVNKTEDRSLTETIGKRYMVEDLGSTDDIDFNDMVVDVIQTTTTTWKVDKFGVKTDENVSTSQKVIVRAVGGTLPFDFLINGEPIFSKSDLGVQNNLMYNTGCTQSATSGGSSASNGNGVGTVGYIDYDYKYGDEIAVTDWNPSTNNVSFKVYRRNSEYSDGGVLDESSTPFTLITFPQNGEVPHILAFPIDKMWRNERRLCCWDWIYDKEPALWIMPENKPVGYPQAEGATHTQSFKDWLKGLDGGKEKFINDLSGFGTKAQESTRKWLEKDNVKSYLDQ